MAIAAMLTLALIYPVNAQDKLVMKLGHVLTLESPYHATAVAFAQALKQKTGGRIEVQIFAQAQLGGEIQMTQALRTGTQDLMIGSSAAVENTIKQWQIFDIPFLFKGLDDANSVMQGRVGRKFLDMMPAVNIVGLAWLSVIERDLFTTRKTVGSIDDLKNLKVRVMQSPGYIAGYKALGANPTPMAYSQLFLALSQGLVDGADTSPEQMIQDKFSDIAKHFYLTRVNYLPTLIAISKGSWSKLSPEQQKAVQEAASEAARLHLKEYPRQYAQGLAQLKTKGIEVKELDTKPWIAATERLRGELIAGVPDGSALYSEIVAAQKEGAPR